MKRSLKIMLAVMLVMTMLVPTLAVNAATVTQNTGYVVVEEDFSAVTDHSLVSATRDADEDGTVDEKYKSSTAYPIGDSDWTFNVNSGSYMPGGTMNPTTSNAYVGEDGKLNVATGQGSFYYTSNGTNLMSRRPAVLYDGDYSKVGDNFKISFDFSKSVLLGGGVEFMVHSGIGSYYAFIFNTKTGDNLWTLYKVTSNGVPETLVSSEEVIAVSGSYRDSATSGSATIVYDNGKISWEISGKRFGNATFSQSGTYTDEAPFTVNPSECKFGFQTQSSDSSLRYMTVDNIKFSYSVPNISEDFSGEGITKDTAFANEAGVQSVRTNITGTDLYVTTRRVSNTGRLSAKVDSTANKLNITYTNASMFNQNQVNRLDFVEYRGSDYEGVGENYTISFDYTSGQSANAGYFIFGLENNGEEDFEYNDYYVLAFSGKSEVSNHINNEEYTIPGWEIRKMTGGDTWSDTIVSSEYTITHDPDAEGASADNTITSNSIREASVTLTVNNGVATVTVDHAKDNGTPDVKTFNITPKGNRFGFSHGGAYSGHSVNYDNIVLTANKKPVEPIDGKVYVYGGKFAQNSGMLLFEVADGDSVSYESAPITITTHEQATASIPEGASKVFFWNNFENIYPLNASVEITQ